MDRKAPLQSIVNFRDVGVATSGSPALPAGRLYRCSGIGKDSHPKQARRWTTHAELLSNRQSNEGRPEVSTEDFRHLHSDRPQWAVRH